MRDAPKSIQIKNPDIIARAIEEKNNGAGRNPTETAETLIREASELRRLKRSQGNSERERNANAPSTA